MSCNCDFCTLTSLEQWRLLSLRFPNLTLKCRSHWWPDMWVAEVHTSKNSRGMYRVSGRGATPDEAIQMVLNQVKELDES